MNDKIDQILLLLRNIDNRFDRIEGRLGHVEVTIASLTESKGHSPALEEEFRLRSKALVLDKPEDEDVILCVDFGTARSKAFGTKGGDQELLDLALGTRAGQAANPHSLLSCVFISDEGLIFFGERAAAMSEHAVGRGSRERFDSFKSMVTNAHPGSDLRATRCSELANPTRAKLSEGDILTLYLAYLTDMAALELVERHGLSRYVPRRFTTPVFRPEHQLWASNTLRRHYCEAILIADQFSSAWNEGIDAMEAERALRAASAQHARVAFLVREAVEEPRAAFASRFRDYEPKSTRRHLISIVDAGAGTTDFATFVVLEEKDRGMQMFLVDGSVHALRKAGNEVDRILQEYILRQVKRNHEGLDAGVLARIRADLSLQQRRIKEDLFSTGKRDYLLADDTAGTIHLDEYLRDEALEKFSEELRTEFQRALSGMDDSWFKECALGQVVVVITGGSGRLPMVRGLGTLKFRLRSTEITCSSGPAVPAWVQDIPELINEFPQLAVALGGASRELPAMADRIFTSFAGLADQGKWVIPVAYKGQ